MKKELRWILHSLLLVFLLGNSLLAQEVVVREQIGHSLGKPVYLDQIQTGKGAALRSERHRLFLANVLQKYKQEHRETISPSESELAAATVYFDKKHKKGSMKREKMLQEKVEEFNVLLTEGKPTGEVQKEIDMY